MQTYQFRPDTSKIHAIHAAGTGVERRLAYTVDGSILKSKISLLGATEVPIATMTHNFTDTRFDCGAADGTSLGSLEFPWFVTQKRFTLRAGGQEWQVVNTEPGLYEGRAEEGGPCGIIIETDPGLHVFSAPATWHVHVGEAIPDALALLGLAALRQRRE